MRLLPLLLAIVTLLGGSCADPSEAQRGLGFGKDAQGDGGQVVQHLASELTGAQERRIAVLREVIGRGLAAGRTLYRQALADSTASPGPSFPLATFDSSLHQEELAATPEPCPFLRYYDNGWAPQVPPCRQLAGQAVSACFDQVDDALAAADLPDYSFIDPDVPQAQLDLWYRRGLLAALSESRVAASHALARAAYCEARPSPVQGSYQKGLLVGRQALAQTINLALEDRGLPPDYPLLTGVLDLCNPHTAILLPARLATLEGLGTLLDRQPLCTGYTPGTDEAARQWEDAKVAYEQGLRDGIADEASLAAVRFYRRVTCAPLGAWWETL